MDSGGQEGMVNHMNDEWNRASVVSSELLVGWHVYSRTENLEISLAEAWERYSMPEADHIIFESSSDYPADSGLWVSAPGKLVTCFSVPEAILLASV
jgi:hypothetical protein